VPKIVHAFTLLATRLLVRKTRPYEVERDDRFAVEIKPRRLGVETKPGVLRAAVETRLSKLGVETKPGALRVAVETKLRRLGVETKFKRLGVEIKG